MSTFAQEFLRIAAELDSVNKYTEADDVEKFIRSVINEKGFDLLAPTLIKQLADKYSIEIIKKEPFEDTKDQFMTTWKAQVDFLQRQGLSVELLKKISDLGITNIVNEAAYDLGYYESPEFQEAQKMAEEKLEREKPIADTSMAKAESFVRELRGKGTIPQVKIVE